MTEAKPPPKPRRRRKAGKVLLIVGLILLLLGVTALLLDVNYAYVPPEEKLLNPVRINQDIAFDLWGRTIRQAEAERVMRSHEGAQMLSAANGAIAIDAEFLERGRKAFYAETFGNEHFATDVLGLTDGPISEMEIIKAIVRLRGRGTNNLRVRLSDTITLNGRTYHKGEFLDTGFDVVPGSYSILGVNVRYRRGRILTGITCAACHSTVDMETGKVVEGAPNRNLNIGVMMAMSANPAAYFVNAELGSLDELITDNSLPIRLSDGSRAELPDALLVDQVVRSALASWPPGTFDSTTDLVVNPSQIPDSFTWRDHPYGWTGFSAAGPFMGLSTLNNNVHALNSDGLSQAENSQGLFGFDKEYTFGIVLQHAARERYRWNPSKDAQPSAFFADVNPTPMSDVFNKVVQLPTYPQGSLLSPDGLLASVEEETVWRSINAMSAFQNTLVPPRAPREFDAEVLARGAQIFANANCIDCHNGPAFTNNRILPASEVGTSPSRALANANTWDNLAFPPLAWSWDTPVPIPDEARILTVPIDHLHQEDVRLAFGQDPEQEGGFKVKGLLGLWWSAPYLHDSSIAVGVDAETELGIPGTLRRGRDVDPVNSLRALLDRGLRSRVIEANQSDAAMQKAKVLGIGHEHWVDEQAGYSLEDQSALIDYLFSLEFRADPESQPIISLKARAGLGPSGK
jgi:hypothetical protein